MDGIVASVHQGSEQLEFPDRALAFAHLEQQSLIGFVQQLFRTLLFCNVARHASHNRRLYAFSPQRIVILPDTPLAGSRHHGQVTARLSGPRNFLQVNIKLVAEFRCNQFPHGNLQYLFHAVTQHPCRGGVHRQKSPLEIVNTQQILAVLHKILIPILIIVKSLPDRDNFGPLDFKNPVLL